MASSTSSTEGAARPSALLFDVLDTLVYDPFRSELPAFFGLSLGELIALKHPRSWLEFELGAIDEPTALGRLFLDERAFDHQALRACMRRAYRWLDGMQQLLSELRAARWPVHLLSNYPCWYELIEDKLALSQYASWSFVSCRTGVRKPSAAAFLGASSALGLGPAELVLIDDQPRNCAAARSLGIDAIEFRGATELRAELSRRGVLPRP